MSKNCWNACKVLRTQVVAIKTNIKQDLLQRRIETASEFEFFAMPKLVGVNFRKETKNLHGLCSSVIYELCHRIKYRMAVAGFGQASYRLFASKWYFLLQTRKDIAELSCALF